MNCVLRKWRMSDAKDLAAAYHRRGIGKKLFDAMRRDYAHPVFTVNSSPYAVEAYRHLGFVPTDTEQLADGLRYTPMRFEAKESERP